MTINQIFGKLRRYNKKNYSQFVFCITLSVMLITSYAVILFSPVVQKTLPEGGDTRKQVMMIFALALVGCLVFTVYAAGLFFKYKSKETGIFLALGAKKSQLKKALYVEVLIILSVCVFVGVVLGSVIAFFIWRVFRQFLLNGDNLPFGFEPLGFGIGILFSFVVAICIGVITSSFMKRTNLMDILNEHRKIEPLQSVSKKYGVLSIVFIIAGVILGMMGSSVAASFGVRMPGIWNGVYLISLFGIYMLLVYIVTNHEKGRKPQRYYQKIIPASMMKFQGKQTVRSMLVVTILLICSLFACFYPPQLYTAALGFKDSPIDYVIPYRNTAAGISKVEIEDLADRYDVVIADYQEYEFIELIGSGVERDWTDEGELFENKYEEYLYFDFLSQSQYEAISGEEIQITEKGYYLIVEPNSAEGFWDAYDDLDAVTNPVTKEQITVDFLGVLEYKPLVSNKGNKYVISDQALESISKGIGDDNLITGIFFNVGDLESSYEFSKELYEILLERASDEMMVMRAYDKQEQERYKEEGRKYSYNEPMRMSSDNPDLMEYWKYYPAMKVLVEKNYFQNFAVFFLLFIYVAFICVVAVGIVSYTRGVTIGIQNKQLFDDLVKLGAKNKYVLKCVKAQLNKIFFLPGVLGILIMLGFELMMFYGNDGRISSAEVWALKVELAMVAAVVVYLYFIYRTSLSKIRETINI